MNKSQTKKVIIVDDEPSARKGLRAVIDQFDELLIIAELGNGKEAIEKIQSLEPDLVFLDIEMPEVGGFEVARATENVGYQLVFVTAYEQYALEAFDTNAIDYLLKPVRPALLEKCIQKILRQERLVTHDTEKQDMGDSDRSASIALSDGRSLRYIKHSHICFIEGIGRYRQIHLSEAGSRIHNTTSIISDTTLEEFEKQLCAKSFQRLHRSYHINLNFIVSLYSESRRHWLRLADVSKPLPISRNKVGFLKDYLFDRNKEST